MLRLHKVVSVRAGVVFALAALVSGYGAACARQPAEADRLAPGGAARMTAGSPAAIAGRRVSTLLDFEAPEDLAFIAAEPAATALPDRRVRRSGRASLLVPATTREVVVKLSSLLSGRSFPAGWTLVGAYIHADRAAQMTLSYEAGGQVLLTRTVGISAGVWTPVMLDLSMLATAEADSVGVMRLAVDPRAQANVHVDDVTLVDNVETVIETPGWSVRRRGLNYVVDAPGLFAFTVPTASAEAGGWSVADASVARVRFTSASVPGSLSVYADGRMYWGGTFRAANPGMADAAEQARQHASPAAVEVTETTGRLNRSAAGDVNNDGYNDAGGAYEITASGPRVELTLSPRTAVLSRPVLEIAGLPSGNVVVNVEGTLVSEATRLANGDVLVELPARIERPTRVSVRVQ